ncbi:MAG TPA: CPBP family intramembrane glutamic endopeptidase [Gemmatimonadaceae bacterium]|nr:CPBP family intramembrane glutamic endopeptidase [Gemmatimonadaceae bacterium]
MPSEARPCLTTMGEHPPTVRPGRAALAGIVLAAFALALSLRPLLFRSDAFRAFYSAHPWQLGESIWKAGWVLIALAALGLANRGGVRAAARELGLLGVDVRRGLLFAFLSALPALITFAVAFPLRQPLDPWQLWMTVIVSPVSEEILFRGFAFRQLHERAGWPLWLALLVTAVPFAWGHASQAGAAGGAVALLGVLAVTGLGAALFAWLFLRAGYNLWFVIAIHSLLNAYWYAFAVSDTAVGGWLSNAARLACILLAVWLSGVLGRREGIPEPAVTGARAA